MHYQCNWFYEFDIDITEDMSSIYEKLKKGKTVSLPIKDSRGLMLHFSMAVDFAYECKISYDKEHLLIPLLLFDNLLLYDYRNKGIQIIKITSDELSKMAVMYERLLLLKKMNMIV